MIFKIEITNQAEVDLRNIYEYIAFQLQSPENAKVQLARLEKSIMSLGQMPERFCNYKNEPWYSKGMHIMPVDNYCVFYIFNKQENMVIINRVMYGGRDIDTQLRTYTKE